MLIKKGVDVFVAVNDDYRATHNEHTLQIKLSRNETPSGQPLSGSQWHGLLRFGLSDLDEDLGTWVATVQLESGRLEPRAITDILLLCRYSVD